MKNLFFKRTAIKFFLIATTILMLIISMSTVSIAKTARVVGDTTSFGNGTLFTWIDLNDSGTPTAIGVTFSEESLTGLPKPGDRGSYPTSDWHPAYEYEILLPKQASATVFNHVGINWNPKGHHPYDVYGIPHFDFHFYTITPEQRKGITATGYDLEKVRKLPSKEYWPKSYIPALAPSPNQMGSEEHKQGLHWVDLKDPTYNGKRFTEVFLYGSYDGEFNFWEPMLTKEYLETYPSVTKSINLSRIYAKSGYYPTQYSINYDANRKEYTVSLRGFSYYSATSVPPKS